MKGLLSGTNKFPGILVMRKRQLGGNSGPRKKSRKLLEKVSKQAKVGIPLNEAVHEAENGVETADSEHFTPDLERPISYEGDKATVTLRFRQVVAMDGWAMVRLVEGRAAVHGYVLTPGVEVLLCSNSKLAAVVTIESQLSSSSDLNGDIGGAHQYRPILSLTGEFSGAMEKSANGGQQLGCILEFQSYRGWTAESGRGFGAYEPEFSGKQTFRIEVVKEIGTRAHQDIPKRKRNDEIVGGSSQGSLAEEEEEISASGDDEDGEEDDEAKTEDNIIMDQVDMDVDDISDPDNILLNGRDRKKPRKEPRAPLNLTVIPETWWAAAHSIIQRGEVNGSSRDTEGPHQSNNTRLSCRAPIIAVCGPKNAGKSTFARFLLNFLLNSHEEVGYLDTDVGQPEFTVPGCLSLHIVKEPIFGSPVLHLRNPEKSFFYGDHSPKGDPEMYCRSVGALFDYFQREYGSVKSLDLDKGRDFKRIPLVINTHGWIKGIGYDVLVDILRHTAPTHVVELTCKTENKNLPSGIFWESSGDTVQTQVLYIESALEGSNRPLTWAKTPPDHLRDSRIMAYFRQCFSVIPLPYPYREDKLFARTALSIVKHAPYQIPVSALKIEHLHCQVPKTESLYSINGAVVGLAVGCMTHSRDKLSTRGLPSSCVGLGIVRGIDVEKGLLYIITPVPVEVLQEVDTLLQGRISVPVPLLQAKGYICPYLCHNSVAIEGTGSVHMQPYKKFTKV